MRRRSSDDRKARRGARRGVLARVARRGVASAAGLALAVWLGGAAGVPAVAGPAQPPAGPSLTIAADVPATPGGTAQVPLTFKAGGAEIASLAFSVDYDSALLSIDPADEDGDGVPDAVAFDLPGAFVTIVSLDPTDADGELDVVITDLIPPLARLPDGDLVQVTFDAGDPAGPLSSPVRFSRDPPASFGSTSGTSIPGATADGSVRFGAGVAGRIYLPLLHRSRP